MNFFGHAVVAAALDANPAFVLGAMLPDLASMARRRAPRGADGALGRGIALHHRCDTLFHAHPRFTELCADATAELTRAGLARGPARAVGHIGTELLLDGCLHQQGADRAAYAAALELAAGESEAGRLRLEPTRPQSADSMALSQLARRLQAAPVPDGYLEPSFVAQRLQRMLAPRPRLAFSSAQTSPVCAWLSRVQPRVAGFAPGLVEALLNDLRRDAPPGSGVVDAHLTARR